MNIKNTKWFLLMLLVTLTGCSIIQTYKPVPLPVDEARKRISNRLSQWEICTARGIVNVYDKNYEFKSDFLLRKKEEKIKLDAFTTGLLGISPSIKLQILYTDSLQVFVPERKTLYTYSSKKFVPPSPSHISTAPVHYDSDSKKFILFYENITMTFNQDFDLEMISYNDIKILFAQYKESLPYQIDVWDGRNLLVRLLIDRWEFGDIKTHIFSLPIPSDSDVQIVPISRLTDIKL